MRKKLLIAVPLLVVIAAMGAYKVLSPTPVVPKAKVDGDVYVLPREFLINLDAGRYAKLGVALVLPHDHGGAEAESAEAGKPPEGYGPLPQEAVVRAIVTDILSGERAGRLISARGRRMLKQRITRTLRERTDVEASGVLFTDVAVQ